MKIDITCRFSGKTLFSHDCEENSLKLTVEAAVRAGACLRGANLDGASLDRASLAEASLAGASLTGASLVGARPIFQIGPIGSRSAYLVAFATDKGLRIKAGCFFGTTEDFLQKVTSTHGNNLHAKEYAAAVDLILKHAELFGDIEAREEEKCKPAATVSMGDRSAGIGPLCGGGAAGMSTSKPLSGTSSKKKNPGSLNPDTERECECWHGGKGGER